MTGERGLAGGFNTNISKLARTDAQRLLAAGKTVKMLMVGRKGAEATAPRVRLATTSTASTCAACARSPSPTPTRSPRSCSRCYEAGEFDVATLYFSEFKSVIKQKPTALQLIPAKLPAAKPQGTGNAEAIHEYEPSEEEVLGYLVTLNISTQIFRGLLENVASFYGAQMSAMDSATRNAGEMIDKLTLRYNRTRQAMITKELIEIISGADAL